MTIETYREATTILSKIDKLKETLERVKIGVVVKAEGQLIDEYFDKDAFLTKIRTKINTKINTLKAQFDAL